MMTPNTGAKDIIRRMDNSLIISSNVETYNEREVFVNGPNAKLMTQAGQSLVYDGERRQCQCALNIVADVQQVPCACNTFDQDFIKSIESWYYPGVLDGIFDRLATTYVSNPTKACAYIVGNDYYRMMLRQARKPETLVATSLKARNLEAVRSLRATGLGCVDLKGEPESVHTIASTGEHGFLKVTAAVKGNNSPYVHHFPKTADTDSFAYTYVKSGVCYVMLFEKLQEVENGDVPFVMYKIRAVPKEAWSDDELSNLKIVFDHERAIANGGIATHFATQESFYTDCAEQIIFYADERRKEEESKRNASYGKLVTTDPPKEVITPVSEFTDKWAET
jgi:hypothetical protein